MYFTQLYIQLQEKYLFIYIYLISLQRNIE